jgi:hypothetical protein
VHSKPIVRSDAAAGAARGRRGCREASPALERGPVRVVFAIRAEPASRSPRERAEGTRSKLTAICAVNIDLVPAGTPGPSLLDAELPTPHDATTTARSATAADPARTHPAATLEWRP